MFWHKYVDKNFWQNIFLTKNIFDKKYFWQNFKSSFGLETLGINKFWHQNRIPREISLKMVFFSSSNSNFSPNFDSFKDFEWFFEIFWYFRKLGHHPNRQIRMHFLFTFLHFLAPGENFWKVWRGNRRGRATRTAVQTRKNPFRSRWGNLIGE